MWYKKYRNFCILAPSNSGSVCEGIDEQHTKAMVKRLGISSGIGALERKIRINFAAKKPLDRAIKNRVNELRKLEQDLLSCYKKRQNCQQGN